MQGIELTPSNKSISITASPGKEEMMVGKKGLSVRRQNKTISPFIYNSSVFSGLEKHGGGRGGF